MSCIFRVVKAVLVLLLFVLAAFGQNNEQAAKAAPRLAASAKKGTIKVAFVVTEGSVMIDFAGPWEVFQDVMLIPPGKTMHDPDVKRPFELYTVSDTKQPIHVSGGMQITPDYTFDDAPAPNIIVIPAQEGHSPKMSDWIRRTAQQSDLVLSVCTGAFTLAETGLLDGKKATTHHDAWGQLHTQYPKVTVLTNMRYVQSSPVIFTSGGLSAGIDMALHVVELYFGRKVAQTTATTMEYEGVGWKGNGSAAVKYRDEMADMPMPK